MKKLFVLFLMITFVVVGCTSTPPNTVMDREPDVSGLIYEVNSNSQTFLVVADIENVDIPYEQWFEAGNYAVYFRIQKDTTMTKDNSTIDFSDLKKGQQVKVWHTGILAESYPMQGEAVHIEIMD